MVGEAATVAGPSEEEGREGEGELSEELEEGEIAEDGEAEPSVAQRVARSHPLEYSWTFWFDNPSAKSKQVAWGSSIRSVHTFATVEDFWSLYNNIRQPSKLVVGADFHCFKYKIEPKWEDPVCTNGGKWTISCARGKSDTFWLHTLLAMIGEQFDYGDEICGAVVSVRRQWKHKIKQADTLKVENRSCRLMSSRCLCRMLFFFHSGIFELPPFADAKAEAQATFIKSSLWQHGKQTP